MPIEVHCDCGKVYDVGAEMSGKKLRCKACGTVLRVPNVPLGESGEIPKDVAVAAAGGANGGEEPRKTFEVVTSSKEEGAPVPPCPACGTPAKRGDAVCLACGADLAPTGPSLLEKVPRPVLLGGGGLVIVLVVLLVGWRIWHNTRDSHYTGLGREKLAHGDARGARAEFEMALKYNPSHLEALEGLLEVGQKTRDWRLIDQHAPAAARASEGPRRARFKMEQARALLELKQPSRAREAVKEAVKEDASVEGMDDVLGLAAFELGERENADEKLRAADAHGTQEPRVYAALARLAADKKDWKAAVEWILKAASKAPEDASIWLEVARFQENAGERAAARVALEKACTIDKKNAEYPLRLARMLLEDRDFERAKRFALAAKELAPQAVGPAVALGEALLELEDTPGARAELERAVKPGQGGADEDALSRAELLLGRTLVRLGEAGAGIERIEKALRRRDKDLRAHLDAGELVLKTKEIKADRAAPILEAALRIDPKSYEARCLLAQALARSEGGRQRAAPRIGELLREAIAIDPKRRPAYLELGTHLDALGDYAAAMDAFAAGEKEFPSERELGYQIGLSAMRARSWDRAIENLKKVGDYKEAKAKLIEATDGKIYGK